MHFFPFLTVFATSKVKKKTLAEQPLGSWTGIDIIKERKLELRSWKKVVGWLDS